MLDENLRSQVERLYESSSMTDELEDTEAEVLLKWGEEQVKHLATQEGDFEGQCKRLRQLIKYTNRFIGQRQYLDQERQRAELERIVKWAGRLNIPVTVDQLLNSLQTEANMSADLMTLLGQISLKPAEVPDPNPVPGEEESDPNAISRLENAFTQGMMQSQSPLTDSSVIGEQHTHDPEE